ncbi:MAG: signal peptidase II [Clostridia bacterium]
MKKSLVVKYSVFSLIAVIICVLDQATKSYIASTFITGETRNVISGILNFTYVKNKGAAFGMLQGQKVAFLVLTVVVFVAAIWYIGKHRPESSLFLCAISFILSGAVGNAIDRVMLGFVRDFIEVAFINFPVFNIADCAICIGAGLLIIHAFRNTEE